MGKLLTILLGVAVGVTIAVLLAARADLAAGTPPAPAERLLDA